MKTFLLVLLIIIAVFWLLGRIRLGGNVRYDEDGLTAGVIAGPFRFTLFPIKELTPEEKRKKRDREEKKKARAEIKKAKAEAKKAAKEAKWREKHPGQEPEPPKKGGSLSFLLQLLPLVGEAAGGLKRRIRIDELTVRLLWAAEDPAAAALGFGRANAIMGMIWPLLDNHFEVKEHELGVSVDYGAKKPTVVLRATLTMRLGQLVSLGLRLGVRFLGILLKSRSKQDRQRRSEHTQKQEA